MSHDRHVHLFLVCARHGHCLAGENTGQAQITEFACIRDAILGLYVKKHIEKE